MKTFAVLQLSGCAGCEVSLLDADAWVGEYQLAYLPLIMSTHDVPPVDVLLVSGGVRNDEELFKLRRAVSRRRVKLLRSARAPLQAALFPWATGKRCGSSSSPRGDGATYRDCSPNAAP
jgi:hypothetical protein